MRDIGKEIIDYIWVYKKSKYQINSFKILSDIELSPNKDNPSDHFPISMVLKQ